MNRRSRFNGPTTSIRGLPPADELASALHYEGSMQTTPADVTLVPADDDTYAVLPRATSADADRREAVRKRLTRAKLGWFLGFDPKSPTDRAEIERRVAEYAGADLTVAWAG